MRRWRRQSNNVIAYWPRGVTVGDRVKGSAGAAPVVSCQIVEAPLEANARLPEPPTAAGTAVA